MLLIILYKILIVIYIYNKIVTFGLNDETAQSFFHALKYTKSVTALTISNAKFGSEGCLQFALCLEYNHSLTSVQLINIDNLGGSV